MAQATEVGSVYTNEELRAICAHAHARGLWVFLDGARLAQALAVLEARLDTIAACGVDAFFIGGTKNGALCGEAVVLVSDRLRGDFRYHMKQRGALLAKGRLLGIQFARLFDTDDLWYQLGAQANAAAARLARGLADVWLPAAGRGGQPGLRRPPRRCRRSPGRDGPIPRLVTRRAHQPDPVGLLLGQRRCLRRRTARRRPHGPVTRSPRRGQLAGVRVAAGSPRHRRCPPRPAGSDCPLPDRRGRAGRRRGSAASGSPGAPRMEAAALGRSLDTPPTARVRGRSPPPSGCADRPERRAGQALQVSEPRYLRYHAPPLPLS